MNGSSVTIVLCLMTGNIWKGTREPLQWTNELQTNKPKQSLCTTHRDFKQVCKHLIVCKHLHFKHFFSVLVTRWRSWWMIWNSFGHMQYKKEGCLITLKKFVEIPPWHVLVMKKGIEKPPLWNITYHCNLHRTWEVTTLNLFLHLHHCKQFT